MRKLLLDTHIFLWSLLQPEKLRQSVITDLLENPNVEKYLSAASSWEITLKWSKGQLDLPAEPKLYVPQRARRGNIKLLTITHRHTLHVGDLPTHHKDPFDRLLITQARLNDLTILSDDDLFEDYDVKLIRADKYERPMNGR